MIKKYLFLFKALFFTVLIFSCPPNGFAHVPSTTEFGFNAGLDANDLGGSLSKFEEDVDNMVANGQKWVRIGIASWLVTNGGTTRTINWNQQNLGYYDQAIAYAYRKGLKIFLLTSGAPDWTKNYTFSDYKTVSVSYWSYLARRWGSEVSVWELFNEADANGSNYRTYQPNNGVLTTAYLSQMNTLIGAGRTVIRQANPNLLITTNCTGYPMSDAMEASWLPFFDALHGNLDIITLHMYPTTDATEINKMNQRVQGMQNRYHQPIAVGEIGLQTCTTCYTEQQQQAALVASMNNLHNSSAVIVLIYEFRDESADVTQGNATFGIEHYDGSPKVGYQAILSTMH